MSDETYGGENEGVVVGPDGPIFIRHLFADKACPDGIPLGNNGELGLLGGECVEEAAELHLPTWENTQQLIEKVGAIELWLETVLPSGYRIDFGPYWRWDRLPTPRLDNKRYHAAIVAGHAVTGHGAPTITQMSGLRSALHFHKPLKGSFFSQEVMELSNRILWSLDRDWWGEWHRLWGYMQNIQSEPTLDGGYYGVAYRSLEDMQRRFLRCLYLLREDEEGGLVTDLERHPTLTQAEGDSLITSFLRSFLRPSPGNGSKPPTKEIRMHNAVPLHLIPRIFNEEILPLFR